MAAEQGDAFRSNDWVILDEIESILHFFNAGTILKTSGIAPHGAEDYFRTLIRTCREANKIIATDADLTHQALDFLREFDPKMEPIENSKLSVEYTFCMHKTQDQTLGHVVAALKAKKKVCCPAMSKSKLESIKLLVEKVPEAKIKTYHSMSNGKVFSELSTSTGFTLICSCTLAWWTQESISMWSTLTRLSFSHQILRRLHGGCRR
mmetsp:Transcript_6386/g.24004  ORF Transcript_6386/g.24004 Transcript_6386/m.24004 type:complete len:207 (-) Transcript_6386:667-1287(-)